MVSQQSEAAPAPGGAYVAAAAPRVPVLSSHHDDGDIDFVQQALAEYEMTRQMAVLMKAQSRLDPAMHDLADELLKQQARAIPDLEALLTLWGADDGDRDLRLDGRRAPATEAESNLALLERQSDAMGFGPFWLLAMKAHQDSFLDVAVRAKREATSDDARRIASAFVAGHEAIDQSLAELGA